jgi:phage gp36-like protein
MAQTPYCTPGDVRALHQLLDEMTFPDDQVQPYIDKAQARINNRLKVHYVVPLVDPIPDIIQSICADMAASLMLQNHFSGVNYREDTPLAEVYRKRADSDLNDVITNDTLNEMEGVVLKPPDVPEMRNRVATSTPGASPLKKRLTHFDNATKSPLASARDWK